MLHEPSRARPWSSRPPVRSAAGGLARVHAIQAGGSDVNDSPHTPPLRPPPSGPSRGNRGAWVIAAVLVGFLAVYALGSGGDRENTKTESGRAKADCGTPSPQSSGDTAYTDVAGAPLVHGRVSCERLLALSRAVTKAPGGSFRRSALYRAQRAGWEPVPDRLVVVADDGGLAMVFGRPGAQVAIVPGP